MVVESDGELSRMMRAVEVILRGIGEDVHREGLLKTPLRVTSAFRGALRGYQLSAKDIVGSAVFSEAGLSGKTGCGGGSGGIVVVSNIDSFALCEDCLLPFRLRCHVAYIPCGERVVGLSKFPRVTEIFAKRLQNPQKFVDEVVEALDDSILPLGVGVIVECSHLKYPECLPEGERPQSGSGWTSTVVHAGKGQFESSPSHSWDEFSTILQLEGFDIRKSLYTSTNVKFCSFAAQNVEQSLPAKGNLNPIVREICCKEDMSMNIARPNTSATIFASAAALASGVESLLCAAGVTGIVTEVLRRAATRFVYWLTLSTQGGTVILPNSPGRDFFLAHDDWQNSSYGYEPLNNGGKQGSANNLTTACSNGNGYALHRKSLGHMDHEVSSNGNCSHNVTHHWRMTHETEASKASSRLDISFSTEPALFVELDIPFSTLCEHHLLPFFGVLHVGYISARTERPQHISRTLFAHIVFACSRKLQAQERLTRQIAEAVVSIPGSEGGAMVVVHASHMCMMSRGVVKPGCTTATLASIGQFSTEQTVREEFLRRLPRKEHAEKFSMDC